MTAILQRHATDTWAIGAPRLLKGLQHGPISDPRTHLAVHGPLPALSRGALMNLLAAAPIAGRGGAGFDFAAKIGALRSGREIIVNGCESEPASKKDRVLMTGSPQLVLDGATLLAAALDLDRVTVATHSHAAADAVRAAAAARFDAARFRVHLVEGGFVSGEARAVLRSVRGGPALPPGRRVHATEQGVLIANVETFAQLAVLARFGARDFAASGTRAEPGTTLLSIGGSVARPGVVEAPIGTPLSIVLGAAGAPVDPQAVVLGGYHGSWRDPSVDVALSRAGAGPAFGAGVVLVLDQQTCALGELARAATWLAAESAEQCGPCRFGLPALAADIAALARGDWQAVKSAAAHARLITGRGACAHPDASARFLLSGLDMLSDELARHRAGGCGRPVLGRLPLAARS